MREIPRLAYKDALALTEAGPEALTPHTTALEYSRRERLYARLFGRWPQSVVDRRLDALDADKAHFEALVARARVGL